MRHRLGGTTRTTERKPKAKILDAAVPVGTHNQVRKSLAKVVHPDINSGQIAAEEMQKINNRLERITAIQEKTTHIQFVVDTSGSMTGYKKELIKSYNKLLERQAKFPGQSTFGFKSFHEETPIEPLAVPRYLNTIQMGGGTPLFDTIGRTITEIDRQLENPTDVVVIIMTDGYDTGPGHVSPHFSASDLLNIIPEKIALGWQFIYCTQERSLQDAERIGIPVHAATTFQEHYRLFGIINRMLLSYRQGEIKQLTFDREDREEGQ
jgi:hypothetical protein